MDLLFQRYASPFSLVDSMIASCRFEEFVNEFLNIHNEDMKSKVSWEFYLHKVSGMTYEEFMRSTENDEQDTINEDNLKATVNESENILKGFSI